MKRRKYSSSNTKNIIALLLVSPYEVDNCMEKIMDELIQNWIN